MVGTFEIRFKRYQDEYLETGNKLRYRCYLSGLKIVMSKYDGLDELIELVDDELRRIS